MCAKKTKGKHRLDKFYHLAKEQGFRSRAAFKLVQLNKKYDFLGNARSLLDLCAAPGGWLQVAHKYMPLQSLIVGIDIVPIKPVRGVVTITEDITTERCRIAIKKTLPTKDALFDVVVCDGAPNVGGAWARESYAQAALILDACKLATEFLAPKGMFITKVFRSQEYHALLYAFQQLFDRVESTKPMASRSTSAEIYVVCKGYKAPSKIDKRLLDPAHMFAETQDDAPRVIDVLNPKEVQKRNRGGYEAGTGVLYKECSAEDFISSDKPADILGMYNKLVVEPETEIAQHPETTAEILALTADLRVLGRKEFKQLLKWRQEILKVRKRGEKEALKASQKGKADGEGGEEVDEEEKLMDEMEELQQRTEARKRREKKKLAKMKGKARERAALGAAGQDSKAADKEGVYADEDDLFSLASLRSKKALEKVADTQAPHAEELEDDEVVEEEDDDEDDTERHYGHTGGSDSDDDGRAEDDAMLESEIDSMYSAYATRRGLKADKQLKRARARLGKGGELAEAEDAWAEEADDDWDDPVKQAKRKQKAAEMKADQEKKGKKTVADVNDDDDDDDDALNPLLPAPRPVKPNATGQALASQWFSNPVFAAFRGAGAEEPEPAPRVGQKRPAARDIDLDSSDEDGGGGDGSDSDEDDAVAIRRASARVAGAGARANGVGPAADDDGDFEIAAADGGDDDASISGSSDTDDRDMELLDDDTKAEIRAYGKLFRHRKTREALIDASYNKRVFNDDDAPDWFLAEERRHTRVNKPVTAAEIKEAKAALRALNARPIKKVAEAKARKRQRATVKMEAARNKANAIADQEDMPMNSRMREIERVYSRAQRAINGKGGGKKGKGPGLDKRMKKDARSMNKKGDKKNPNRKNPNGGGKKKGGGGGGAKGGKSKGGGGKGGGKKKGGKR